VSVSSLPIVSVDGVPSKAPEVPSAAAPMPHPEPKRAETAQGHATGVAEHVRVRLERKTSGLRGPFNHPGEAGRRERGASLADEGERRRFDLPLEPPQGSQFITPERMGAWSAVLDPADGGRPRAST
jgi:hypothetical protein